MHNISRPLILRINPLFTALPEPNHILGNGAKKAISNARGVYASKSMALLNLVESIFEPASG